MTHELLLTLQDLRMDLPDVFTSAMLFMSSPLVYLGIPLAFATVIFLCMDKKLGEWIMLNMAVGMLFGHFLKDIICNPRPWVADDRIHPEERALKGAGGYSTPSGHSTDSTTGFLSPAVAVRRWWFSIMMVAIMLTIMFSRLFLGVHTLLDIVTGALLALAVMTADWILLKISYSDESRYDSVSVVLLLILITVCLIWTMITEDHREMICYGAFVLGTITGRLLEHHLIGYEAKDGSFKMNLFRAASGLTIVSLLFLVPYLTLGYDPGVTIGGLLAPLGLFVVSPAIIKRAGLNN